MKFKEKIKDIREAMDNEKLVIFVGSGVSNNSNIPTWSGLIEAFAKEMRYDNCNKCDIGKDSSNCNKCSKKYDFSQDEFLKIPQYYYDTDKSDNKENYKEIIRRTLGGDAESNEINNIIFELNPDHIITTNYDTLIENTRNPKNRLYKCVYKDEDLLKQSNNHYIIKMHGDIDDLDSIVLKEKDYISYSQTHVLIETKIKSLLIDHTFLFVGYSLNDYNLKLILGWINYLAKENNVLEDRPRNYIIQIDNKPTKDYIEAYLKESNVYVINTNDLPKEIIEKNNHINLKKEGKLVYSCLDYILDSENDFLVEPLADVLADKYKIFKDFKRISFEDLIEVYPFKRLYLHGNEVEFSDKDEYEEVKKIVSSNGKNEEIVKDILNRTGIRCIFCFLDDEVNEGVDEIKIENNSNKTIYKELFSLYLNNNYNEILKRIEKLTDEHINLKIYYYYLINYNDIKQNSDFTILLDKMKDVVLNNKNIYDLILYTFYKIMYSNTIYNYQESKIYWKEIKQIINLIPATEQKAYTFLKKIIFGMSENLLKQQKLLEKHEEVYLNKDGKTHFVRSSFVNLLELQGLAYDYYFYFKLNNFPLDYFSKPRNYFKFYLKSILCTYTPDKNKKSDSILGEGTYLEEYEINEIDLDMFVKYMDPEDLNKWMNTYNVKQLKLSKDFNNDSILLKFENYCKSMINIKNTWIYDRLHCFCIILSKLKLDINEKKLIVRYIYNLFKECLNEFKGLIVNTFDSLFFICKEFNDDYIEEFKDILECLINYDLLKLAKNRCKMNELEKIAELLYKYSNEDIYEKIDNIFKLDISIQVKHKILFIFRKSLSKLQKEQYSSMLISSNLEGINYYDIFLLINDGILTANETVIQNYIGIIEYEIEQRRNYSGRTFPDRLADVIKLSIILNLIGKLEDISFLNKYKEQSIYLQFIFDPDNFDYTKLDINDYMWGNLFKNKKYLAIILKNKDKIDIEKLRVLIKNESATEQQKKIFYRYLVSEDEFWKLY